MKGRALRTLAVISFIILEACSSSHSTVIPGSVDRQRAATARFTMHWPTSAAVHSRHSLFISPSTQSVVVEVNNDSTLTTTLDKPKNGAAFSSVTIPAPAGADSFTISTWDQAEGLGNELGQITVSQTITLGASNVLNATVDGLLQRAGISAASDPFLRQSLDAQNRPVFTLLGDVEQTFTIVPEDADSNIIVPPGDAPSLTMTSFDPNVLAVTPVAGKPDVYTVSVVAAPLLGEPLALKIAGSDGLGNSLSTQYAVNAAAVTYVAYAGASGASSSIRAYDEAGAVLPTSGSFAGIGSANALTYDPDDHLLFVTDQALGTLTAFDTQGNADATFSPVAVDAPGAAVYVPAAKTIYVAQRAPLNSVKAFTAEGKPVDVSSGFSGLDDPCAMTYASPSYENAIYIADCNLSDPSLGTITPFNSDGSASANLPALQYTGSDGFAPYGIAYDSAADAIYSVGTVENAPTIYPLVREFQIGGGSFVTGTGGLTVPTAIAYNSVTQELYVTNANGAISAYTVQMGNSITLDTSVTFAVPSGISTATAITVVP